jgi:hypothetical protein
VEIPVKAAIACECIVVKSGRTTNCAIHGYLDDIRESSDPDARAAAVKNLWRRTWQMIMADVLALERYSLHLQGTRPSPAGVRESIKDRGFRGWHQGSLKQILNFYLAYPTVVGGPAAERSEWDDIWERISGTLPLATGTTKLSQDGQDITPDTAASVDRR